MSILASKTIAINIVDVQDGHGFAVESQLGDFNRLALLEAQVKELTRWKRSISPVNASNSSDDSESGSDLETPGSELSLDTRDLLPPPVSTGDALKSSKPAARSNLPAKKPDMDMTSRILTVIQGYGHNEENAEGEQWLGRAKFEPRVRRHVDNNVPVDLVLPAFPWKSVNKVEKVLGALPDLGEELALGRLQNLCEDIQAIYPPGAYVTITSDGLVYSDLVGISSEEVFEYGLNLRRMAVAKGYDRLKFMRIMNLVGVSDSLQMTKEEYVNCVEESRKKLMEKYLPQGFDARDAILNDVDINLTYCGYIMFLNKDLRYSPVTANVTTKGEYKRTVKRVANDMITRGKVCSYLSCRTSRSTNLS